MSLLIYARALRALRGRRLEYGADEDEDGAEAVIENPDEVREQVRKILEFKYKYPRSGEIPAKTSVTAIKEMEDAEHALREGPVYMTRLPVFLRGEKSGAQIGTAHHQVMAYIDIEKIKNAQKADYAKVIAEETKRIAAEGQLDKDIASDEKLLSVICENVRGFFESEMGSRVLAAKNVRRESPFEIEITAREYDASLTDGCDGETVIVQGIIDLYFEEENGDVVLVDYKTDRCKDKAEQKKIADKYKRQLRLYAQAMEKIKKTRKT